MFLKKLETASDTLVNFDEFGLYLALFPKLETISYGKHQVGFLELRVLLCSDQRWGDAHL